MWLMCSSQPAEGKVVNMPNEKEKTQNLLASIDDKLGRQISFKHAFLYGIIRGVGTAIGATVIAAIVFALLGAAINSADEIPLIGDVIDKADVQQ